MVVGCPPSGMCQGHQVELTKSRSGAPSLLKSKKATPPPIVSGNNLSPYAPLLCTKLMPADFVMSANPATGIALEVSGREVGASDAVAGIRDRADLRSRRKET